MVYRFLKLHFVLSQEFISGSFTILSLMITDQTWDKHGSFDTKNHSPPSKMLEQKFKSHRLVLMTCLHNESVSKFPFICFLKS